MNKLVLDNKDFRNLVSKICRDITNSKWRPDYVVGLTRGGLLPAVMISHYFDIPCETLKVSLRDNVGCESNCWMAEDAYDGKHILIVDDINDTGATLNWIKKDWSLSAYRDDPKWNGIWNETVKFATLIDNDASPVEVNYIGSSINKEEDDVWVTFPWEEWWRA